MINEFTILSVILGALFAAPLIHWSHRYAAGHDWTYIPRYVCGSLIVMVAFAPVLFTMLDWQIAGFLLLMLGVLFAAAGLVTWLEHDADRQRDVAEAVQQAERVNRRVEKELKK